MLSKTKESIGRASCHAIDCAKHILADEVSLISVIFQYGKQEAHFYFLLTVDFFTFGKLMMKIVKD